MINILAEHRILVRGTLLKSLTHLNINLPLSSIYMLDSSGMVRINLPLNIAGTRSGSGGGALTMKKRFAAWAARHKLSFIAGSWVVTMTAAGAIIISDPWVLYFLFAPCLSCMRSCTNRSSLRIIMDVVSSHRHIPVQHKGCKNLLTFSAILVQWPW